MVTWAAVVASEGTNVTAVAPLPMTTTRWFVTSRSSGHCWGCRMIEAAAGAAPADELVPALQSVWDTVGLVHHITELTGQICSL